MKKKLTEIYGLKEGPFDDINKQLSMAKSVAGGGQRQDPRRGNNYTNDTARMQADVDSATSIVKKEAMGDDDGTVNLPLTSDQLDALVSVLEKNDNDPQIKAILNQIEVFTQTMWPKGNPYGSSRSSSMTKKTGGLKLQ